MATLVGTLGLGEHIVAGAQPSLPAVFAGRIPTHLHITSETAVRQLACSATGTGVLPGVRPQSTRLSGSIRVALVHFEIKN